MATGKPIDLSDAGKANCCMTKIEFCKCVLAWSIENFSYCRQSTGEAMPSCIFSSDDPGTLKFRLDLYPRGTGQKPNDIVVGIRIITDRDDVRAVVKYSCFIYNSEKAYYDQIGEFTIAPGRYSHEISLVNRQELLQQLDKLLPGDILIIGCAVRSVFNEGTVGNLTMKSHM